MAQVAVRQRTLVESALDDALADAIKQAATRSEHIRLTRIASLVAWLREDVTDETQGVDG